MARTKASRGTAPFTLRSGNSPLQLFGGLKNIVKKVWGATPMGIASNALKGNQGGGNPGAAAIDPSQAEVDPAELAAAQAQKAAMGGAGGSDEKLEAINEILNS